MRERGGWAEERVEESRGQVRWGEGQGKGLASPVLEHATRLRPAVQAALWDASLLPPHLPRLSDWGLPTRLPNGAPSLFLSLPHPSSGESPNSPI